LDDGNRESPDSTYILQNGEISKLGDFSASLGGTLFYDDGKSFYITGSAGIYVSINGEKIQKLEFPKDEQDSYQSLVENEELYINVTDQDGNTVQRESDTLNTYFVSLNKGFYSWSPDSGSTELVPIYPEISGSEDADELTDPFVNHGYGYYTKLNEDGGTALYRIRLDGKSDEEKVSDYFDINMYGFTPEGNHLLTDASGDLYWIDLTKDEPAATSVFSSGGHDMAIYPLNDSNERMYVLIYESDNRDYGGTLYSYDIGGDLVSICDDANAVLGGGDSLLASDNLLVKYSKAGSSDTTIGKLSGNEITELYTY
jgi:hypothetical protein